jgi:hypothetical protein
MKVFNVLSGPWTGLSIQGNRRLTESIRLTISRGRITGDGSDVDGDFVLDGSYDAEGSVTIDRRYTRVASGDPGGTWAVFRYQGRWDGAMVHGRWAEIGSPSNGGPFEMWPDRDEDRAELAILLEDVLAMSR